MADPVPAAVTAALAALKEVPSAGLQPFLEEVSAPSALSSVPTQLAALNKVIELIPTSNKTACAGAAPCMDWLLAVFRQYPTSVDLVERAALILQRVLYAVGDERPFMPCVPTLAAVLESPPSVMTVSRCVRVLCSLAYHAENKPRLLAQVPLVESVLAVHADTVDVVDTCVNFFANLAACADNKASLMAQVPTVITLMRRYASSAGVCDNGVLLLFNLSNTDSLRPALREAGAGGAAEAAVDAHPTHAEIPRRGRGVMERLGVVPAAVAAAASTLPEVVVVSPASLAGFRAAVSTPAALADAAKQLAALTKIVDLIPTSNKPACAAVEALADWVSDVIVRYVARADLTEKALVVLCRASWATADERELMKTVPAIRRVLEAPPSVLSAVHCLSALGNLGFNAANKVPLMALTELVASVMTKAPYANDATLAEKGCLFFTRLSVCAENLPGLQARALPAAVAVLQKHSRCGTLLTVGRGARGWRERVTRDAAFVFVHEWGCAWACVRLPLLEPPPPPHTHTSQRRRRCGPRNRVLVQLGRQCAPAAGYARSWRARAGCLVGGHPLGPRRHYSQRSKSGRKTKHGRGCRCCIVARSA